MRSINLGWNYKRHGDAYLAMNYFHDTLHICQRNYFDIDHSITVIALVSIGDTSTDLDVYQNALDYLKKGFQMFKRILPSQHTKIANTLIKFENLFDKQSLLNRAIKYYHSGYKMAQITMPTEHPCLLEYLKYILNVYNKINKIEEFH
ncbi:unnamed protein product [Rotaria sp. Silwood1]|nr:unnamed protein product [Rotaria sp. Silwood1]CAF1620228.1 unnamed protein product [Rotaria sp. Silwood1]CAF3717352.1 unnamed protein product [Rotaria sp. Silwood1]CAF3765344.1 unnamed protein product [Rotaria sp. Silwood1]CAF4663121.1 unnamed protein product [Rotaria sp. Silwood1]